MKSDCQIVICGDLCPTPDTVHLFESGDAAGLFKGVLPLLHQADFLMGNLEFPLTDLGKGIAKCGPVLKGKTACLKVLKEAGFNLLCMANNHIRDCGDEGVLTTLKHCHESAILTVGAGKDAAVAKKPTLVEVKGWKIGVLAYAEQEFNAATENCAGANLFDPYESFDEIKILRQECDYLIILYHGGVEYYVYPSPVLQKKCRKMVEVGADVVLCQHSHCVGTVENYQGGAILYGQGNTVYGYRPGSPAWNEGLLVTITLSENVQSLDMVKYVPIVADASGIDLMPSDREEEFLGAFYQRSQNIDDKNFIDEAWLTFCKKCQAHHLPHLLGLGRALNHINRVFGDFIIRLFYSKKRLRITMNLIRCEAHREMAQTILEANVEESKMDHSSGR